ncbi:hypothetical protein F5Y14DRAFT_430615 [Nemania sp. NC0429]|nr:hypothetical protein F5Y14DRAFT_430615 [Nemania sp. NC0429]
MAPLCKFYQQGNCRNGASCRFEHPGAETNPFGAPNTNRFNALNKDGTTPYKITKDSIKVDLAEERPSWILSCYGPGKDAPEQLFGGYPREQSLEEVMMYVKGSANQQQALSEVMGLYNHAEQQIQATLGKLDAAVEFILTAENSHPNRIDICKQNTIQGGTTGVFAVRSGFPENPLTANSTANQNPFSAAAADPNPFASGSGGGGGPTFGQPSSIGQKPNPFGPPQPQFGQPSQMGAGGPTFGQPSQMGAGGPAFGQPSQMGAGGPAFGQPSQMGGSGPAFGQPSTIGARPNPFSAASTAGPSPFTQVAQPTFGQPSVIGQSNPFQAAAAPAAANPFSQQGPAAPAANPFSQPKDQSMDISTPGPAPNNPFGPPPSASNGFNTQAQPTAGTGFPSATPNPFSNPGPPAQPQANPFQNASAAQAPSAAAARPGPYPPGSTKQHPPVESYIAKAMNGRITSFRGRPVIYKWKVNDRYQDQPPENQSAEQLTPGFRKPDGTWCKILFPAGPPPYSRDTEPEAAEYDETARAAYARMAASGRFEGDMPEVPPMREDCVWTF